MDSTGILPGCLWNSPWIPLEFSLDAIGILPEFHWDSPWIPLEFSMDSTGILPGYQGPDALRLFCALGAADPQPSREFLRGAVSFQLFHPNFLFPNLIPALLPPTPGGSENTS